jgi:hypothetical protein
MTKRQLIEAIQELNPTAQVPFLGQFCEADLEAYLDRLRSIREGRLRIFSRIRRRDLKAAS